VDPGLWGRSSRRSILGLLLLVAMAAGLVWNSPVAAQRTGPDKKVDPAVIESLQANGTSDFVIVMAEQADLSQAYNITDWDERGWYVYNALKATAERTQKNVKAQLTSRGLRYHAFLSGNEIYVHRGTQQALEAALDLPEVDGVRAPVVISLGPVDEELGTAATPGEPQAALDALVTWGLENVKAPQFWSMFGRRGEGILVANIDSGVQYNHPALAASYKCAGGILPENECWYDPVSNPPSARPQDGLGHGTHTMGTIVASDAPALQYTAGMAPRAQWIACRAFITTSTTNEMLNACADWVLAPGGDPSKRPHVVNNSWGDTPTDEWFLPKVQAWRAAGIFPVFSAGNEGKFDQCSEIGSPAEYQESFAVAAHDSSGTIASFSSQGPGAFGDVPYTKPNLSAPGVSIVSADPILTWATRSGTSMAAPHVAGAVALLWSCNPALVGQIDQTFQLLQNSARDALIPTSCGGPAGGLSDYTYGYGYLDVFAAGWGQCIVKTYLPVINR